MNDTAALFLKTYAEGGEVEGGWAFPQALRQARLDFSEASLGRLDTLLDAVRTQRAPERATFIAARQGRNFSSLVVFYLVEYLRRRSGATVEWHDYDSARRKLNGAKLPEVSGARLVAIAPDQGAAFMPLLWLESRLFEDRPPVSAADFLADVRGRYLELQAPIAWYRAARDMGVLASWQMFMAFDGGMAMPTMLRSSATGQATFLPGTPFEETEVIVARHREAMQKNPEGAPWQAASRVGVMELPSGRSHVVMIEARAYGARPMSMTFAFPYRPAQGGQAFSLQEATFLEATVESNVIELLSPALMGGIDSFKWPRGAYWDQFVPGARR